MTSETARAVINPELERWMHDTTDAILAGPISVPAGTEEKDPDAISPKEA